MVVHQRGLRGGVDEHGQFGGEGGFVQSLGGLGRGCWALGHPLVDLAIEFVHGQGSSGAGRRERRAVALLVDIDPGRALSRITGGRLALSHVLGLQT